MESQKNHRTPLVRLIAILLTAVFLLTLVPLLLAARYALPESDDLLYGQDAREAFVADRSLGTLCREAAAKVAHHHQVAHGRYSNTFFGAAFLGAIGLNHYSLVPALMLFALIFGTMLFAYALLVSVMGTDKWTWLAVSMFVLLFCVQLLPSPAEGLFWFCGGLGYTLYYGATLIMLALLLFVMTAKKRAWRITCGVLAVLLAAVVAGLGFTVMIVTTALLIGYIVLAIIKKRHDMLVFGILTLAVFVAGVLIQLTAPATSVRAAWEQEMYGYQSMGVVKAVLLSFVYALCTLLYRVDGGMILYMAVVSLLLAPFLKKSDCRFRLPLVGLLASFCLYATLFTASLYATSSMGPYRQWNVMYFMEFPFWGVNAAYVTGWCIRRMERKPDGAMRWSALCERTDRLAAHRMGVLAVMALMMLSSVLIHDVYDTTAVAALQEMRGGTAQARFIARTEELATGSEQAAREASRLFLY